MKNSKKLKNELELGYLCGQTVKEVIRVAPVLVGFQQDNDDGGKGLENPESFSDLLDNIFIDVGQVKLEHLQNVGPLLIECWLLENKI